MSITTARGLRTSVSGGLPIQMRRVPSLVSSLKMCALLLVVLVVVVVYSGSHCVACWATRHRIWDRAIDRAATSAVTICTWHILFIDFALLQKLFCMKGVEGTEVMYHGHQFRKNGFIFRVLGQQDAVKHHFKLTLNTIQKLGVP